MIIDTDDYVYECMVFAECITNRRLNFWKTFAVCTSRNRAKKFCKGYLLEEWKHRGYVFTRDKVIPGHPGHIYYVKSTDGELNWELTVYVIRRHLNDLWTEEEEDDDYE